MTSESKAKNIREIEAKIVLEESNYERLSLLLIGIKIQDKEWEKVCGDYNSSATKIHFLNEQMEIVKRTGKMLGDSTDVNCKIYGNHYYED